MTLQKKGHFTQTREGLVPCLYQQGYSGTVYRLIQARKCWVPRATAVVYLCLVLCTKRHEQTVFLFTLYGNCDVFLNDLHNFLARIMIYQCRSLTTNI